VSSVPEPSSLVLVCLGSVTVGDGYWSEGEHCIDHKNQHVKGCWVVDWVMGKT